MTRIANAWMAAGLLVLGLAGCEDAKDTPEKAARKVECRKLNEHIFQITPESKALLDEAARTGAAAAGDDARRAKLGELVAGVPIEDIEQCAAADPKVIACMQQAPDQAALRACIPPPSS